ncbi:hypothetical protein F4781DRAFT_409277 [Annulohypoxylon bovei var. microspora]|nr:hypothetical protein F4781DRAFT_409277 [Annulohypoxylon bovei var. microspora]
MGYGSEDNRRDAEINRRHSCLLDVTSATGTENDLFQEQMGDNESTLTIANGYGPGLLPSQLGNYGGSGKNDSMALATVSDDVPISCNEKFDWKTKEQSLFSNSSGPEWDKEVSSVQTVPNRHSVVAKFEKANIDLLEHGLPMVNTLGQVGAVLRCASSLAEEPRKPQYRHKNELDSICSINLGLDNTIYRWTPGSTIKYNVNGGSFPTHELATHASKCLEKATSKWNDGKIGVQFERVADDEKAVFRLEYEDIAQDDPGRLAHAFLPEPQWTLQRLWVYKQAFTTKSNSMTNIFCHELGHILGLRHEFSLEEEKGLSSVQWGPRNPLSIMSYSKSFRIQETDTTELRRFYEFRGKAYQDFEIVDLNPKCFYRQDF